MCTYGLGGSGDGQDGHRWGQTTEKAPWGPRLAAPVGALGGSLLLPAAVALLWPSQGSEA